MNYLTHAAPTSNYGYHTRTQESDISLGEVYKILHRRRKLVFSVVGACLLLALLASLIMHKKYTASGQLLLIQYQPTTDAPTDVQFQPPTVETIETQLGLIQSDAMAQRASTLLRSESEVKSDPYLIKMSDPENLRQQIKIDNPKDSNLLDVSIDANSPAQAAVLVNGVLQAFVQWKREMAQQQVGDLAQNLEERTTGALAQVQAAEDEEREYKQSEGISDTTANDTAINTQLYTDQQSAADLQIELNALNARLQSESAQLNADNKNIGTGLAIRDDAEIQTLQQQLNALEIERDNIRWKYKATFPGVYADEDAKVNAVKSKLLQAMNGVVTNKTPSLTDQQALLTAYNQDKVSQMSTQAKLHATRAECAGLQAKNAELPAIDARFQQLDRQVALANTLYTSLKSKLDAARLYNDSANGNVNIAQTAVAPETPSRPIIALNLALGFLLGLFLATVAVLIAEQKNPRIYEREEASRILGRPVIGEIQRLTPRELDLLSVNATVPDLYKACSLACGNLSLLAHQTFGTEVLRGQTILVTSAVAQEGKSIVAREFARVLAGLGNQVLLVEAGEYSDSLSLPRSVIDSDNPSAYNGDIHQSDTQNLWVLPISDILAKDTNTQFLKYIETLKSNLSNDITLHPDHKIDTVIIDASAGSDSHEALFLVPHVDCVVQVVASGVAEESEITQMHDALTAGNPKIFALVINHMNEAIKKPVKPVSTRPRTRRRPDAFRRQSGYYPDSAENGSRRVATAQRAVGTAIVTYASTNGSRSNGADHSKTSSTEVEKR